MTSVNVADATGVALNWMVAKCEGIELWKTRIDPKWMIQDEKWDTDSPEYSPSTNWVQAGLIIDREDIDTINKKYLNDIGKNYMAYYWGDELMNSVFGPTRLIAAMRMYVLFKLGEVVEVPENLL